MSVDATTIAAFTGRLAVYVNNLADRYGISPDDVRVEVTYRAPAAPGPITITLAPFTAPEADQ